MAKAEMDTLPDEHQKLIVLCKISCKSFAELITYFAKTHDPAVLPGETIANTLKGLKHADIEDMKKKLNNSGHIFDTQAAGTVIKDSIDIEHLDITALSFLSQMDIPYFPTKKAMYRKQCMNPNHVSCCQPCHHQQGKNKFSLCNNCSITYNECFNKRVTCCDTCGLCTYCSVVPNNAQCEIQDLRDSLDFIRSLRNFVSHNIHQKQYKDMKSGHFKNELFKGCKDWRAVWKFSSQKITYIWQFLENKAFITGEEKHQKVWEINTVGDKSYKDLEKDNIGYFNMFFQQLRQQQIAEQRIDDASVQPTVGAPTADTPTEERAKKLTFTFKLCKGSETEWCHVFRDGKKMMIEDGIDTPLGQLVEKKVLEQFEQKFGPPEGNYKVSFDGAETCEFNEEKKGIYYQFKVDASTPSFSIPKSYHASGDAKSKELWKELQEAINDTVQNKSGIELGFKIIHWLKGSVVIKSIVSKCSREPWEDSELSRLHESINAALSKFGICDEDIRVSSCQLSDSIKYKFCMNVYNSTFLERVTEGIDGIELEGTSEFYVEAPREADNLKEYNYNKRLDQIITGLKLSTTPEDLSKEQLEEKLKLAKGKMEKLQKQMEDSKRSSMIHNVKLQKDYDKERLYHKTLELKIREWQEMYVEVKKEKDDQLRPRKKGDRPVKSDIHEAMKEIADKDFHKRVLRKVGMIADVYDKEGFQYVRDLIDNPKGMDDFQILSKAKGKDLLNLKSKHLGYTPLHYASIKNKPNFVEKLIDLGIDVNSCDENQETPLHFAAKHGAGKAIITILAKPNININAKAIDGMTAIMYAAMNGYISVIRHLLNKGCDVKDAFELAKNANELEACQIIQEHVEQRSSLVV